MGAGPATWQAQISTDERASQEDVTFTRAEGKEHGIGDPPVLTHGGKRPLVIVPVGVLGYFEATTYDH